jgi:hypothetical protein
MTQPAAIGEIAAAVSAAAPADEQLELMPPTHNLPGRRADAIAELVRRDRAGRPPGAKNLKTRDAVDFVRRVMGDPLIDRARWAMHTPASLALELGCTKLEAFDRLDKMRADLARFMYAPLAPVDDKGNPVVPFFAMQIGGAPVTSDGQAVAPWLYQESEQNQGLPQSADPVSHGYQSHGDAK